MNYSLTCNNLKNGEQKPLREYSSESEAESRAERAKRIWGVIYSPVHCHCGKWHLHRIRHFIPFSVSNKKKWEKGKTISQSTDELKDIFLVVALDSLAEENLKNVSDVSRREYDDKETSGLNQTRDKFLQKLGFGPSCQFPEEMKKLKSFMDKYNLTKKSDLVTPKDDMALVRLTHRKLADKLLLTNKEKYPKEAKEWEFGDVQKLADFYFEPIVNKFNLAKAIYAAKQRRELWASTPFVTNILNIDFDKIIGEPWHDCQIEEVEEKLRAYCLLLAKQEKKGAEEEFGRWENGTNIKNIKRVFTGYNLEWKKMRTKFLERSDSRYLRYFKKLLLKKDSLPWDIWSAEDFGMPWCPGHPMNWPIVLLYKKIRESEVANTIGSNLFDIQEDLRTNAGHDLLIYTMTTFCTERNHVFSPFLEESETNSKETIEKAAGIFLDWIKKLPCGWLDVIPYNENLVFLKGENGEYDFLIKGMRDEPFDHRIYPDGKREKTTPFLKNSDVPESHKSQGDYHFNRWLYFTYDGWYEKACFDIDRSESKNQTGILFKRMYSEHFESNYHIFNKNNKSIPHDKDFTQVDLPDKTIFVSKIITVSDFQQFLEKIDTKYHYQNNPLSYEEHRKRKDFPDYTLFAKRNGGLSDTPAVVSWYDALAYASWIEKTKKIPVRLLKEDEYNHLYLKTANLKPLIYHHSVRYVLKSKPKFEVESYEQLKGDYKKLLIYLKNIPKLEDAELKNWLKEHPIKIGNDTDYTLKIHFSKAELLPFENWEKLVGIEVDTMMEDEFGEKRPKYSPDNFPYHISSGGGFSFYRSVGFGEWLNEHNCAIDSMFLGRFSRPTSRAEEIPFFDRSSFQPGFHAGFRLCYQKPETKNNAVT